MTEDGKENTQRRHLRGAARQERRQRREAHKTKRERKREADMWSLAEDGWNEHGGGSRRPERARKRRADKKRTGTRHAHGPPEPKVLRARVAGIARGRATIVLHGDAVPAEIAPRLRSTALTVGDSVDIVQRADGSVRIEGLRPRTSVLSRVDPGNAHKERLIAANVDLGVIVVSATAPPLRPGLIDRFLIALERGRVGAVLCVNKIDLCPNSEERERLTAQLEPYRELELPIVETSVLEGRGVDDLRSLLAGRTSVFVGHSGVGKSSLLNALAGNDLARPGSVRARDGRGRHTTTSSALFELDGELCVIDTPGIRAFGLHRVGRFELSTTFPGFEALLGGCRYGDCTHQHEPACAVRRALQDGRLSTARYAIYVRLMEGLDE